MQYVTLIISGLAFIMSLSSWIHILVTQRRKIRISFLDYSGIEDTHTFYVSFENLSRLPVSISRIFMLADDKPFECTRVPIKVLTLTHKSSNNIVGQKNFYSLDIPISIPSLGAVSGYVAFEHCPKKIPDPPTVLTFLVHANRGRPFELSIPLDEVACQGRLRL
jgi:hypothetical protein